MLNRFKEPLPAFNIGSQTQNADLLRAVAHDRLRMRLTGAATIVTDGAAGATRGTVVPLNPASLIESIRIVWDGRDLVAPIRGEDIVRLTRRCVSQPPEFAGVTSTAGATTDFAAELIIPFARPWLANPYDTVLPALPVRQQFKIYVKWNTSRSNAKSDPGSGAIIAGGTDTVTLADVSLNIVQEYSEKPFRPWYIPIISVQNTDQFAAATATLPLRLLGANRFDSVMLIEEDNEAPATLIDSVSFVSGNRRYYNGIPRPFMENDERALFPGVPSNTDEPGTLFLPFADGGKLTNVVNPGQLRAAGSDPRFEFATRAPAGTGLIRAVTFELMTVAGLTQIQDG